MERYSSPVFGKDGKHYGRIWTFRDITKRKRAEESQTRLATAVEQAAEAVVITDTDGKILYVNPAFEAVTGYSQKEIIGQNPRMLKSGKHDDSFYRRMWTALVQRRSMVRSFDQQKEGRHPLRGRGHHFSGPGFQWPDHQLRCRETRCHP